MLPKTWKRLSVEIEGVEDVDEEGDGGGKGVDCVGEEEVRCFEEDEWERVEKRELESWSIALLTG
jgi:hypothetical protein